MTEVRWERYPLAAAYADDGYFTRNLRSIDVLIDQDAVRSGAAARGEPWRFYDLGHGLCTYEFFDQCPHRMACARWAFYGPKPSGRAQLLGGRANLLRLRQEIPLTDEEVAAVDDGLAALAAALRPARRRGDAGRAHPPATAAGTAVLSWDGTNRHVTGESSDSASEILV